MCLRGAEKSALQIAKKILLYLVQVRLSLRREISFYIDMGMTQTLMKLEKEPTIYAKKPRVLASSPNIVFGRFDLNHCYYF